MKQIKLKLSMILSLVCLLSVHELRASDIQQMQSVLYPYKSMIELQDDFLSGAVSTGTVGSLGWFVTGTTTSINGEANAPGILRKDTSAVSGTVSALLLSGTQQQLISSSVYNQLFRARLNTNDANTTVRIGLTNSCTVSPVSSGIYFEKLDADTSWFAVNNNAGSATRTTTGVAVNTSFNEFSINKTASAVEFRINGVLTNTIATDIPTGSIQTCMQIVNSAAAAKTFDIDYFQLRITGLVR